MQVEYLNRWPVHVAIAQSYALSKRHNPVLRCHKTVWAHTSYLVACTLYNESTYSQYLLPINLAHNVSVGLHVGTDTRVPSPCFPLVHITTPPAPILPIILPSTHAARVYNNSNNAYRQSIGWIFPLTIKKVQPFGALGTIWGILKEIIDWKKSRSTQYAVHT